MNRCTLEGRLSGAPEERTLPSGDCLVTFRVVVPRDGESRVDTIDCQVETAALRRRLLRMEDGTTLHVEGRLQRRFFRSAQGPASRYEVRVDTVQRMPVAR